MYTAYTFSLNPSMHGRPAEMYGRVSVREMQAICRVLVHVDGWPLAHSDGVGRAARGGGPDAGSANKAESLSACEALIRRRVGGRRLGRARLTWTSGAREFSGSHGEGDRAR